LETVQQAHVNLRDVPESDRSIFMTEKCSNQLISNQNGPVKMLRNVTYPVTNISLSSVLSRRDLPPVTGHSCEIEPQFWILIFTVIEFVQVDQSWILHPVLHALYTSDTNQTTMNCRIQFPNTKQTARLCNHFVLKYFWNLPIKSKTLLQCTKDISL
jgi:hypothetical protein